MSNRGTIAAVILLGLALSGSASWRDARADDFQEDGEELVSLDFDNVELKDVIDTIARVTRRNFIYDDRVRGRVTIVSPTPIPVDQAYAVFESVLQVKGFTTVETPGGALKVIPVRDAKTTTIETVQSNRRPPNRDLFVTRLIPLQHIEAGSIVGTLKPLISKDAAMEAYAPTNMVILTESSSNIRRIIAILEAIDVDTYKDDIAVLHVEYAEASTLASQISEIYGAEVSTPAPATSRRRSARPQTPQPSAGGQLERVRLITDERTNSIIAMAPRGQMNDVRDLVRRLDVPVTGGGQIHVYYLQHADAEELAQTLAALISGTPTAPAGGAGGAGQAQSIRTAVTALAEGIAVTADPATNSLVIQARKEGYDALLGVIERLDIERPQVLVEALIMEADVDDSSALGFNGVYRLVTNDLKLTVESLTEAATRGALAGAGIGPIGGGDGAPPFLGGFSSNGLAGGGSSIQGIIAANASSGDINIISAPHVLTSDNEEAEIRIGDNIPIITSRVQSAAGQELGLSSSVNVERQDIGVTLRVKPQITEGESLRLEIFQEISDVNESLSTGSGAIFNSSETGVALTNRRIENTVVVHDGDTVVVGGLISDRYFDSVVKVPFLGDIPILGWAFKTKTRGVKKVNLLVFLTPHIVRSPSEMEFESIRKREEFASRSRSGGDISIEEREREEQRWVESVTTGQSYQPPTKGRSPVRNRLLELSAKHPAERMREIEQGQREEAQRKRAAEEAALHAPVFMLEASMGGDADAATRLLTQLVDTGYEGELVSREVGGSLLLEVRIGPFPDIEAADDAAEQIRRTYQVEPNVVVVPAEKP